MKLLLFVVIAAAGFSLAQDTNKVVTDDRSGKPMLVGQITREAFRDTSFSWWYDSEYENYESDTSKINEVRDRLLESEITIIMGTWCSDSRRELPRFLRILDYAGYPEEKINIISVDRSKKAEGISLEVYSIELVPTFIFFVDGEEIGRIVESPAESLEQDMLLLFQ